MSVKTILVTGANGFVGSNLYDALSHDFHLVGLDITGPGKYPPGDFFGWDELDKLPPSDAIIHLAGKAHDTSDISSEEEYFEVNLGLTRKIFNYFLQSTAGKFIFFSSVKSVADTVKGEWLSEEEEPYPQTPYGRSKLAAERYILNRLRDLGTEGLSEVENHKSEITNLKSEIQLPHAPCPKYVYILRPAMIHGPGNKGNLNLLFETVRKGIPWPLGAFENQRSFTSIGNVAFVIQQMLEKEVPGGIYNLADDETVSTNEIIRLTAVSLGRNPRIWKIPKGLIHRIARLGDLLHFPLNSERLGKLTENFKVSNSKIKSVLKIDAMPVRAMEGLRHTFSSFST
jgi:nucleoside-diphosphate-sugar epimerase